ncbi:MAG: prepilin-type N-terminal cleavage/methylation domain-containing protein [Candidatus Omnitrophota bacterium]|nr:prepilin-type N-terminal cleavage/methylation domain-containing protein [Candidatus Omnitrophota bacterium]
MSSSKGFTLVEVLVSLLILSLLVAAMFMVLNVGDTAFNLDLGMLELQQQARQAMNAMVRELRQAQNLTVTVIDQDSDRLTFSTVDEADISYYRNINNSQLIREYPAGVTKVLANNITYFKCALVTPLLTIQLRAGRTFRQKPMAFSLTEKVRLRNE